MQAVLRLAAAVTSAFGTSWPAGSTTGYGSRMWGSNHLAVNLNIIRHPLVTSLPNTCV
jgi:hypothetical protein